MATPDRAKMDRTRGRGGNGAPAYGTWLPEIPRGTRRASKGGPPRPATDRTGPERAPPRCPNKGDNPGDQIGPREAGISSNPGTKAPNPRTILPWTEIYGTIGPIALSTPAPLGTGLTRPRLQIGEATIRIWSPPNILFGTRGPQTNHIPDR